jgi:hypothetical protein
MEFFIRDMYLVFDPAGATSSPAQYEVVSVPRVPDRDEPDDEFTKQLRRIYRNYPRKLTRVGRSLLGSEWPPSPYVLDVFSSATGRWEKRSFARDGEAAGILADMQPDFYPWEARRRSVYWKGALYVHCEIDFVMRYVRTTTMLMHASPTSFNLFFLKNTCVDACFIKRE